MLGLLLFLPPSLPFDTRGDDDSAESSSTLFFFCFFSSYMPGGQRRGLEEADGTGRLGAGRSAARALLQPHGTRLLEAVRGYGCRTESLRMEQPVQGR